MYCGSSCNTLSSGRFHARVLTLLTSIRIFNISVDWYLLFCIRFWRGKGDLGKKSFELMNKWWELPTKRGFPFLLLKYDKVSVSIASCCPYYVKNSLDFGMLFELNSVLKGMQRYTGGHAKRMQRMQRFLRLDTVTSWPTDRSRMRHV